jgi:hypothetical protein
LNTHPLGGRKELAFSHLEANLRDRHVVENQLTRKGRPPPNRYRRPTVRPEGFQDFGLKYLHDWVLPQLGVRDRRQMFNRAAAGSIWSTATACAFAGGSMVGVVGAIVGGVLGLLLADSASASIASSAEEEVTSDQGCHGCGRDSPGRFS